MGLTQSIAEGLIWLLGWKLSDASLIATLRSQRRLVCIFPHTSYFDFFLMILYRLAMPSDVRKRIRTIVRPDLFNYHLIDRFLIGNGCIPGAPREKTGAGRSSAICEELEKADEFILLLNPTGSRDPRNKWRSGWWTIARATRSFIVVVGPDYSNLRMVAVTTPSPPRDDQANDEQFYRNELRKIPAMYSDAGELENRPINTMHFIEHASFALAAFLLRRTWIFLPWLLFRGAVYLNTDERITTYLQGIANGLVLSLFTTSSISLVVASTACITYIYEGMYGRLATTFILFLLA